MKYRMNQHTCLLCMGSNYERGTHIAAARTALSNHFPNILFSTELETEAIGSGFLSPFSNQLAFIETNLGIEELRTILKDIERKNGRLPSDKAQGIVKLDIDILIYNKQVLKKEDLQRDFVRKLLEETVN